MITFNDYKNWVESNTLNLFTSRYLPQEHLYSLLSQHEESVKVESIGFSEEGKEIKKYVIGKGVKSILIWSQMHGNEPTGTMALVDLIKYLQESPDYLPDEISLHIIPMLNPDGAEVFTRRNGVNIDLNRDALKKECAESKILFNQINKVKPHIAFNLHDQRAVFSAGMSKQPAVISLLVPSTNVERTVTHNRKIGMQLTARLWHLIPEPFKRAVGRYTDEYYPTATGDVIQNMGINCILIESGSWFNDPMRNTARLLNGFIFLTAIQLINQNQFDSRFVNDYQAIPENEKLMKDVIIRNTIINGKIVDLAFSKIERFISNKFLIDFKLDDLGDLRHFNGYKDVDFKGEAINLINPIDFNTNYSEEDITALFKAI